MVAPRNFHEVPLPAKEMSDRLRLEPSVGDPNDMARRWRPFGFLLETALATIARVALRLIDRTTGMAYSADELETRIIGKVNAGTVLILNEPPVSSGLRILGSLTIDGNPEIPPFLMPTGEEGEWTDTGVPVAELNTGWAVRFDDVSLRWDILRIVAGQTIAVWYGTDTESPEQVDAYYPLSFGPVPISGIATIELGGTPATFLMQSAIVNGKDLYSCIQVSPVKWLQVTGQTVLTINRLTVTGQSILNETTFNDRVDFNDNTYFMGGARHDSDSFFAGKVEFAVNSANSPASNGGMVFQATSNTSILLKYRGTDGTVRSATTTLAP